MPRTTMISTSSHRVGSRSSGPLHVSGSRGHGFGKGFGRDLGGGEGSARHYVVVTPPGSEDSPDLDSNVQERNLRNREKFLEEQLESIRQQIADLTGEEVGAGPKQR